jgi:aryl-alcohol dehydrogenase-like predicted oxidoreductase
VNKRNLGLSALQISPVTLGAWAMGGWFWGGADDDESAATVRAAVDVGITSIDTAPVYGFGHSERVLGRAIRGIRDQVQILTKVGLRWDCEDGDHFFDTEDPAGKRYRLYRNLRPDSVRAEVDSSLARLGVDHIDLIQCHWPDPSTPIPETMGALAALVQAGKVGAVGVSNFSVEQLAEAQAALGDIPLASDQPKYSVLDRRIERDVLPWCRENQVGVVVYSPMARGLLTGRVTMDRVFAGSDGRSTDPRFHPVNRKRVLDALAQLAELVEAHGITPANLVVAWALHQPGITAALVGARTPAQARENAAAATVKLSDEEWSQVDAVFGSLRLERKPGA